MRGMELELGRWRARLVGRAEAGPALDLRARLYRGGAPDEDRFDAGFEHLLIEEGGDLAASARLARQDAAAILRGYTAQFYDLRPFAAQFGRAVEIGRICVAPEATDPAVPRILLAVMTWLVLEGRVPALYGCTSFGADGAGMARLGEHAAPRAWAPRTGSGEVVAIPDAPGPLPPMLRAWLSLGAGVSDHAVVDRDLGTIHVFTGLPVAAIPRRRAEVYCAMLGREAPADYDRFGAG